MKQEEVDKQHLSSQAAAQYELIERLWNELEESGLNTSFGVFMASHAINVIEDNKTTAQLLDCGPEVEAAAVAIKYVKRFQQAVLDQDTLGAMD